MYPGGRAGSRTIQASAVTTPTSVTPAVVAATRPPRCDGKDHVIPGTDRTSQQVGDGEMLGDGRGGGRAGGEGAGVALLSAAYRSA